MNMETFQTSQGDICYWTCRASEQGPWLVFLPGLTADRHLFDKQIEYFEGRVNCLVWDAPAHGDSRPFALEFSMDDLARWLHEILQREGIEKPVLVGQSMGGYISQVYMELYPEDVSGFVSIDSCPLQRRYFAGWELALLKRTKWMYEMIPWKWLLKWGSAGTARTEYGRRLMLGFMESYEKGEYCALADHGFRIVAQAVEMEREYRIPCPVLLLCGEKDTAGSAKRYNRSWVKNEGYPMVWLEGAGHNSNTDVPQRVNALLEEFLSKLG